MYQQGKVFIHKRAYIIDACKWIKKACRKLKDRNNKNNYWKKENALEILYSHYTVSAMHYIRQKMQFFKHNFDLVFLYSRYTLYLSVCNILTYQSIYDNFYVPIIR